MNDDQFDDLKQFIVNTVSQTENRLQAQISQVADELGDVRNELGQLRSEMASGFEGVAEAVEQIHQQAEMQEAEVNRRFTKLEQQTA